VSGLRFRAYGALNLARAFLAARANESPGTQADWRTPADVKRIYANASVVGENRVVFNIGGNKYRLVIAINYPFRICYVRFIGTHQAYDRVDVETV